MGGRRGLREKRKCRRMRDEGMSERRSRRERSKGWEKGKEIGL
jgi:hypothetical protein